MAQAAERKVSAYSRGMRQRLGIADVLMKDPSVIIMDEPTLGLDPEGTRELIALIRQLSTQDGRTILISSHQLYQVQQICDRVGIFVQGRLIACGPIQELGRQLENEGLYILEFAVSPADEVLEQRLRELEGVTLVQRDQEGAYHVESHQDLRGLLLPLLAQGGYTLLSLRQRGGDLDEIYRKYFEKAGEQGAHTEPQQKRGGLLGKFAKKQG